MVSSWRQVRAVVLGAGLAIMVLVGCGDSASTGPSATVGPATVTAVSQQAPPVAVVVGTPVKTDKGSYTDITAQDVHTMLEHKDFFMVDVHVPNEGKLPNLDARIPYDQIASHLDQLPADKNARIVLTCRSDRMSTIASRTLADLGYTNIYNMRGGFNAWKALGYPFFAEQK